MEWLFGKKLTPEEQLKEHQRTIQRAIRELDRERMRLEMSEKKLIMDIKKNAKQGQMGAAKVMAKDLVRTRSHVQKMIKMKTQLQAVSLRLQTVKSQNAMATAIKGVARAMVRMNQQIDIKSMQQVIMEFEKQSEILEQKEEMIGDTMDDMMDVSDEEAETEDVIDQVLTEIGINLSSELGAAPTAKVAEAAPAETNVRDKELEARLENLRRG